MKDARIIEFGARKTILKLRYVPFKFHTSALNKKEKIFLRRMLKEIPYAMMVDYPEDATHIIANEVKITSKVLVGLVMGFPIVSCNFVKALSERKSFMQPLPKTDDYLPTIVNEECELSMLNVRIERKKLFLDKTFVIVTDYQLHLFKTLIEEASGKVIDFTSISESNMNDLISEKRQEIWLYPNVQVITDDIQKKYSAVVSRLHDRGITPINDSEIAKAILFVDIEKYCNPQIPIDESQDLMFADVELEKDHISLEEESNAKKKRLTPTRPTALSQSNSDVIDLSMDDDLPESNSIVLEDDEPQVKMEPHVKMDLCDDDIKYPPSAIIPSSLEENEQLEQEIVHQTSDIVVKQDPYLAHDIEQVPQGPSQEEQEECDDLALHDGLVNYKKFKKQKLNVWVHEPIKTS